VSNPDHSLISEIFEKEQQALLDAWLQAQANSGIRPSELRKQATELLKLMSSAASRYGIQDPHGPGWREVSDQLANLSRTRALQGANPTETAAFILALKQPLFARLGERLQGDSAALTREVSAATALLDRLALVTSEAYQRAREEVISRQQQELLELSTPVVKLWDGILALPLIGTLDSARTQVVMETLLQRIVETGAEVAIIDITGVPTVDTLVAQHLLKTVTAARLMGADCIISGIRPQIAQTIVHLGVELHDITTKASLADAFRLALRRSGQALTQVSRGREKGN